MNTDAGKLLVVDAGVMGYRAGWDKQLELHERVLSGELAGGALMLVEHRPVITIGRRADAARNLLASEGLLKLRGVEVVETDRGGDITFHGPGQLVVYPIINLNSYGMNLHGYMRFLEGVVIGVLREFGVEGLRVEGATGVWVAKETRNAKHETRNVDETRNMKHETRNNGELAKVCAMGVKLRRWVTLHGLALNVTTDLSFFELINPCGLGRPVTSLERMMGERGPSMEEVKGAMVREFEGR